MDNEKNINDNETANTAEEFDRTGGVYQSVNAHTIIVRQGGVQTANSDQLTIRQGGVMNARTGHLELTQSSAGLVQTDNAQMNTSSATALVARGDILMDQSNAKILVAGGEVKMDQAASMLMVSNKVSMQNSGTIFIFARQVEGDLKTVFGPKETVVFAVISGLIAGTMMMLGNLFRRKRRG